MHSSELKCEDLEETVGVLNSRLMELDARLLEAKRWRAVDGAENQRKLDDLQDRVVSLTDEAAATRQEKIGYQRQLQEMSATVLRLVDKNNDAFGDVELAQGKVEDKETEVGALRTRVKQLLQEVAGEGRARVETEEHVKVRECGFRCGRGRMGGGEVTPDRCSVSTLSLISHLLSLDSFTPFCPRHPLSVHVQLTLFLTYTHTISHTQTKSNPYTCRSWRPSSRPSATNTRVSGRPQRLPWAGPSTRRKSLPRWLHGCRRGAGTRAGPGAGRRSDLSS